MAKKSKGRKQFNLDRDITNSSVITTRESNPKKIIAVTAKNQIQKSALKAIHTNKVTFLFGSPGSGKSHVSVGYGIQELMRGHFEKLILTRPAIEAGEHLGFLPGGYGDKLAPYLIPLYDILLEYISFDEIQELEAARKLFTLPLAFQRGITYKNSFVVVDEAQNASIKQMHMLLTRIGEGSKVVVTGDVFQSDLRDDKNNGLIDAIRRLQKIDNIAFVEFDYSANCRDPIVSAIDSKYRKELSPNEKLLPKIMKEIDPNWNEAENIESIDQDFDEYRDTQK